MTDRKDETGKGQGPGQSGEGSRRPYATIDLKATEVPGEDKTAGAAMGSETMGSQTGPEGSQSSFPPPNPEADTEAGAPPSDTETDTPRPVAQRTPFATHLAAGVTGGAVTLGAAALFGLLSSGDGQQVHPDVGKRIAALEQRAPADVSTKLAQTDTRLKGLEEQARTLAAINDAQNKLAANIKALEARGNTPELNNRLAKIETSVAALSANDSTGQAAALADKLTGLEKQVNDALEVSKSGSQRIDRGLADVKTESNALSKRLETLKGDLDERLKTSAKGTDVSALSAKLGAFESDLQGFLKGESDRSNNAARVLLALEIASLKRTMDRGERYSEELKAVQKLAGNTLNLAPLQKYAQDGAPTLPALTKEFRQVADAAMDAEAEPSDGSVLDRLVSSARSIVRVRKSGYDAGDQSTEAVLGRMDTALTEGRLDEVMAQGSKLPPKAALVAEDWLKKVEARRTVDRALADIEMAMKTSLTAGPAPAAEPRK